MAVEATENVKMGNEEVRQVSSVHFIYANLIISNNFTICRPLRTEPALERGFYSFLLCVHFLYYFWIGIAS